MIYQKLIAVLVTLSCLLSCKQKTSYSPPIHKSSTISADTILCNVYGPFTTASGRVRINFTVYSDSGDTTEYIKIRAINSSHFFYSANCTNHSYNEYYQTTKFSAYIPFDEVLLNQGIEVFVYVAMKSSPNQILTSASFPLFPKTKHYVNTKDQKKLIVQGSLFKIPYDSSSDYLRERFYFDNIPATFANQDYFTLPLDGFTFTYYHEGHSFSYTEAYLTCDDPHNLFPYMKSDGIVKIPLKLTQNKRNITIGYKNNMYVDEYDLTMSLTAKLGYSQTSTFYMPRGKNKELDETEFKIVIISAGKQDTDITMPVTYYSLNNRFGNCDDSEYCVRGGIVDD